MSAEWGYLALACSGLPLLVYLAFFLARKDVSLRVESLFALVSFFLAVRLVLLSTGVHESRTWWLLPGGYVLLLSALLVTRRTSRSIHASASSIRAEIEEACRRLFIQQDEPAPGEIRLTAKGGTLTLRLLSHGGAFATILLPRRSDSPKLTLFLDYLHKRYPGPIPRIRVTLDRR